MKNDITENAKDLARMIGEGKLMEAFEKYYADDVSMQENEAGPTVGKDVNRKREEVFVNGLTKINKIDILGVGIGDDCSFIEYHMDVEHKDYGPINRSQVTVQRWLDGKIVKEKFYYDPTPKK